jgi:hypothetical protein
MDDQLLDSHPRRHDTEGEWQVPVYEEVVAPPAVRFVVVLERFVSGGRGGIDMHHHMPAARTDPTAPTSA